MVQFFDHVFGSFIHLRYLVMTLFMIFFKKNFLFALLLNNNDSYSIPDRSAEVKALLQK